MRKFGTAYIEAEKYIEECEASYSPGPTRSAHRMKLGRSIY